MPVIQTHLLSPETPLPSWFQHTTYCGLDCCLTSEIRDALEPQLQSSPNAQTIYSFERALQGPYLDLMLRGFAIDELARKYAAESLGKRIESLQSLLDSLCRAACDRTYSARSYHLRDLFYSHLQLPEIWLSQKGEKKLSLNREALEKLYDRYLYARPFINCILTIRDLAKQKEVFETEIKRGRFFSSYNIAGTETGRPSSSSSAFGDGGNAQNIAPSLRYVFIPDLGYKLCVIDYEQVEARDEGFFCGVLFSDWSLLNSCESGDLHTANAKRIWPELGWDGNKLKDRELADKTFYRDFSYRDMAKRGSHLCLTEDHEVLTPHGWVPITTKPIQIMAWNEMESSFEEVQKWNDEEYTGDLHSFEGNSISLVMTENHRVPYKSDQRNIGPIRIKLAKDGPGTHMPLGDNYVGGSEIVPARLIAAFMSDGYQASTNRMNFHLKKERKIKRLEYLCNLYNFTYEHRRSIISVHGNLPKRSGPFMFEWTQDCLRDFLDEYRFWDGHIAETAVTLFSIDRNHLEWIQTFGRILGIGGNLRHSTTKTDFGGISKIYETDYYSLQQNNRKWATGKSIIHRKISLKEKVRVLCPTVKSSFFYIRHKGKISVTGNSNYMGTAWTAARALKVPQKIMEDFQARYCRGGSGIEPAYPCIPKYWQWCAEQLQTTHFLTTPFGRRRHFFGRPEDDTTLREAIAFLPQSTTADRTNLGLWRIWKYLPEAKLLAQTFDSITFQYLESTNEDFIINRALELLKVELTSPSGRSYVVPGEAKVGWNWGNFNLDPKKGRLNPGGLKKWQQGKKDERERPNNLTRILQN